MNDPRNAAHIGHLANNRALNLNQSQERIDNMKRTKAKLNKIAKLKPVRLDWKVK